jgi:group I intron endonuclease
MDFKNFINKGIYCIKVKNRPYIYIGSTQKEKGGFSQRWYEHKNLLENKKHFNPILQNIYNKYGKDSLIFEILETINDVTLILSKEEEYIKKYLNDDNAECINLSTTACGGNGWHKFKTKEELKKMYEKVIKTRSLRQPLINLKHKETIKNTPKHIKEQRLHKHLTSYIKNLKSHKTYKPIHLKFIYPNNKKEETIIFETEQDFFKKTLFETSILNKLKKYKKHIIKRIWKHTKHLYPTGTIISKIN